MRETKLEKALTIYSNLGPRLTMKLFSKAQNRFRVHASNGLLLRLPFENYKITMHACNRMAYL